MSDVLETVAGKGGDDKGVDTRFGREAWRFGTTLCSGPNSVDPSSFRPSRLPSPTFWDSPLSSSTLAANGDTDDEDEDVGEDDDDEEETPFSERDKKIARAESGSAL